ncbi:hypothetical protein MBMB1_0990 [Methanobacterium sp. MB1]|jgi:hypothetical protein|nr:hypothetical protein MBMB1_0990 [Methanobacterium sp. MB1]
MAHLISNLGNTKVFRDPNDKSIIYIHLYKLK